MEAGGFQWSRRIPVEQEDSNREEDLVRAGGIHSGSEDSSGVGGRLKTKHKQI